MAQISATKELRCERQVRRHLVSLSTKFQACPHETRLFLVKSQTWTVFLYQFQRIVSHFPCLFILSNSLSIHTILTYYQGFPDQSRSIRPIRSCESSSKGPWNFFPPNWNRKSKSSSLFIESDILISTTLLASHKLLTTAPFASKCLLKPRLLQATT